MFDEWQGSAATALAPQYCDESVFRKNRRLLYVDGTIPTVPWDPSNLVTSLEVRVTPSIELT